MTDEAKKQKKAAARAEAERQKEGLQGYLDKVVGDGKQKEESKPTLQGWLDKVTKKSGE
ncbi:hypothetical protein [Streptomyces sp. 3N207]|uniref:hypothetical protein n=1 Tax=Streptomyces sp. 3N207 TaxID=3457417 RepID=UPI003FD0099D